MIHAFSKSQLMHDICFRIYANGYEISDILNEVQNLSVFQVIAMRQ